MMRSGLWFFAVGGAAGLTHLAVFYLLEQHLLPTIWPELANFLAFCAAFLVSFAGHRFLSFRDAKTTVAQSFQRFFWVALAGFACNELVFSLLLHWFAWPSMLALLAGLAVAAGQTYVLSRFWAFSR